METNTMTQTTVELDITYEGSLEHACDTLIGDHLEVWWEVKVASGPGGGWPVVAFTGPATHIGILVYRYCGEDAEHAVDVLPTA